MDYKASLDPLAKGITIGVIILFVAIGSKSVLSLMNAKGNSGAVLVHAITLLVLMAILAGSWLYAPRHYSVDNGELVIHRMARNVKLRLDEISSARMLAPNETRGMIRTFGVGGLFGYFGKFHSPVFGHSVYYATQRKNQILISTHNKRQFVITPDDASLLQKIAAPH